MPLELVTIPCLTDNYAYLIHDPKDGETAVIDVPDGPPVLAALAERGWALSLILITHHHSDHIQGVEGLRGATRARVVGNAADTHRLPPLDLPVNEGDTITIGTERGHVLAVPGHTRGHIAYHFPASQLVFTGDSLMACGCGRLFEGTGPEMWDSLSRLARLPPGTMVCSGHEYAASNVRFALALEPDNAALVARSAVIEDARNRGRPTVPSRLSEEIATNPFLRASLPHMKHGLGLPKADDATVFTEIRARRDRFQSGAQGATIPPV